MSRVINVREKGDFKSTLDFLKRNRAAEIKDILKVYGEAGVQALSSATPKDTGKTAASWSYTIEQTKNRSTIYWTNSNVNKYVNIALILQYGHATRNGGWVEGRDYINPALRPIMDSIAARAWEEVSKK